jgi:N-acyl-D-amino-acid deacylase
MRKRQFAFLPLLLGGLALAGFAHLRARPVAARGAALAAVAASSEPYDLVITNGRVIDGTGNPWFAADVGIRDGRIAAVGRLCASGPSSCPAKRTIDAAGLYVAPGFIDMLGQSETSILVDPRAESKIRQGITTEVTGEGGSVAPQNEKTLPDLQESLKPYGIQADWRTLEEYFARFQRQGSAINLGTNVGAAQVRQAVLGEENRAPNAAELERMKQLVDESMEQGALGISSALIYAPGTYARTEELIELSKVAARYGGVYSSHMRNEGEKIFAALDEAFRIGREAGLPVHIYHLKVAGKPMWGQMGEVIARIERERAAGHEVTANMYAYLAGANGLSANLPSWVLEGGTEKALARLRDPGERQRIKTEMSAHGRTSGNFAQNILINLTVKEDLRPLQGKRLSEIAAQRKQDPLDTMLDILIEDRLQTGQITFMMSEADARRAIPEPWVSFGCDYPAVRPDGVLGRDRPHPRAYGNFPRLLGHYVREEHLLPLEQMIRKMTSLAAQTMRIEDRGVLRPGMWADVTIFDAAKVRDLATYENPHQYSEGIRFVLVNGEIVLDDGKMTSALPGRPVRGPGYRGK